MKNLLKILLTLTLISSNVLADCEKPVITLTQGQQAPCKGFLFSPQKEQEVRMLNEDYTLLQQELTLKNKQIDLYKKDISDVDFMIQKERDKSELWRKAAEDSTKQLVDIKEGQGRRDWLMIFAGIALTVGAGYAVGQAANHR